MSKIEMHGITKNFGSVQALKNVDFELQHGEIHALLGENGAGKTTLMRVLYGMVTPDSGEIRIDGVTRPIHSTRDAMKYGIGMVHQHFMLADNMTVYENVAIGYETQKRLLFDKEKMIAEIKALSLRFKFDIDPCATISDLPVGQKQRIEIIKAIYRESNIIILDEPTAVLTPQEVDVLFDILLELKKAGKGIVIITHKLKECMRIADRITVMRDGSVVATDILPEKTSSQQLADLMVGRNVTLNLQRRSTAITETNVLSVRNLNLKRENKSILENINFDIHQGEILGVAGVEGNGQRELAEVLSGNLRADTAQILLYDQPITGSTRDFIACGVALVPEDRETTGLVTDLSIAENIALGYQRNKEFSKKGLILKKRLARHAETCMRDFSIKAQSINSKTRELSGGNQQKVVVARVVSQSPQFIIFAQPTRGVDVGAINNIHKRILDYRDEGNGVLLISADLDEVRSLSDRLIVMYGGRIVAEGKTDDFTESCLGALMLGGTSETERRL